MHKRICLTFLAAILFMIPARAQSKIDAYTEYGKRVYITSSDSSMQEYATDYIKNWGYWHLVDEPGDADLTIRFVGFVNGNGDVFGYVDFIDPSTDKILLETKPVRKYGKPSFIIDKGFTEDLAIRELRNRVEDRDAMK